MRPRPIEAILKIKKNIVNLILQAGRNLNANSFCHFEQLKKLVISSIQETELESRIVTFSKMPMPNEWHWKSQAYLS